MGFAKKFFLVTLFISILMEEATTSKDPWSGSFAWYFHADLKSWLPQTGIPLTPIELSILLIFLIWTMRGPRNRHFRFERGLLFWPIMGLAGLLVFGLFWGVTRSGSDFTVGLWEVRALALAVLAYFLVGILFTHRRDLDTVTWIVLISTALLGIECIVRYVFFLPGHVVGDLDYDHEDANLLGFAIILALAMLMLGSTRRQKFLAMLSIPLDAVAMALTHRRTGFGALAVGLAFLAIVLFRANRPLFLKIVPISALLLCIYLGAEWNCSYGTLCQPARAITSQIHPDPRDASSNLYRIIERNDLIINIQANTLTGRGFGNTFVFYIPLPSLSFWRFWHYTSHNAILWIWVKAGMFGFIAFWWLIASGLFRSGRLIQALTAAGDKRALALLTSATCLIAMQIAISYVDLGLTSDRAMLLLGVMFGVIGHLPGILRRSTDAEVPELAKGEAAAFLDAEEPEVQAGVLASVLVATGERRPPSKRRTTSYTRTRPQTRRGQPSHWGAPEQSSSRSSNRVQPSSFFAEERAASGRTATQAPPEEETVEKGAGEEFPWSIEAR